MEKKNVYYWIKLRNDFFSSDEIDFLMSQANGSDYVVLYQMLCLKTANSNGELATRVGEVIIKYDAEKIARDCKYFNIDVVRAALLLYQKLGLVYVEEDNVLKIANIARFVGSESANKDAVKKRIQRLNKAISINGDKSGDKMSLTSGDKMSYRDKSIDIRDKSIDIRDIEKEKDKEKESVLTNTKEKKFSLNDFLETNFQNDDLKQTFKDFIEMRKSIKKPMTDKAIKLMFNKLNRLTIDEEEQIEILNQSILNSWQDVYALKCNNKTPKKVDYNITGITRITADDNITLSQEEIDRINSEELDF